MEGNKSAVVAKLNNMRTYRAYICIYISMYMCMDIHIQKNMHHIHTYIYICIYV